MVPFRPLKGLWAAGSWLQGRGSPGNIDPWDQVHVPALQSHSSHQGGPGFPERGFFNFLFLESSVPGRADTQGAAGASETRGLGCPLSPAPSQFLEKRDFPEKSVSWLPPSLPNRLSAKVPMKPSPVLVSLLLLLREAK